jgi:hypothetical protein
MIDTATMVTSVQKKQLEEIRVGVPRNIQQLPTRRGFVSRMFPDHHEAPPPTE